jgi:hypothetical protein
MPGCQIGSIERCWDRDADMRVEEETGCRMSGLGASYAKDEAFPQSAPKISDVEEKMEGANQAGVLIYFPARQINRVWRYSDM